MMAQELVLMMKTTRWSGREGEYSTILRALDTNGEDIVMIQKSHVYQGSDDQCLCLSNMMIQ